MEAEREATASVFAASKDVDPICVETAVAVMVEAEAVSVHVMPTATVEACKDPMERVMFTASMPRR